MKRHLTLFITVFAFVSIFEGQTNQTVTKETYTVCSLAKPLLIQGRLFSQIKSSGNYLPFGSVVIKGTRIGSQADSLGYYSIDVTRIADTAKNLTLVSSYPGLRTQEIVLKNKVTNITKIDFVLIPQPACELPDIGDGKKKTNSKRKR